MKAQAVLFRHLAVAARFAVLDHIIGIDLRFDHKDRWINVIIGVPFVSVQASLYKQPLPTKGG